MTTEKTFSLFRIVDEDVEEYFVVQSHPEFDSPLPEVDEISLERAWGCA